MRRRETFTFVHLGVHFRKCLCDVNPVTGRPLYVGRPNYTIAGWYFTGKETREDGSPHFMTKKDAHKAIEALLATEEGAERVRGDIRRDIVRRVLLWHTYKDLPNFQPDEEQKQLDNIRELARRLDTLAAYPLPKKRKPHPAENF